MFIEEDYKIISELVFKDDYPGYKPNVIESPNGDGYWDGDKKYAHVAEKYLEGKYYIPGVGSLYDYLITANDKAIEVAIKLGVPKAFWPDERYGALRVLEYPPVVEWDRMSYEVHRTAGEKLITINKAFIMVDEVAKFPEGDVKVFNFDPLNDLSKGVDL